MNDVIEFAAPRGIARGVLRVLEHPHQLFSKLLTCIVLEYCTSADQTGS